MFISRKIKIHPNIQMQVLLYKYIDYQRFLYNKGLKIWYDMYELYKLTKDKQHNPTRITIQNKLRETREEWENRIKYPSELNNAATYNINHAWKLYFKGTSNGKPKFKSKKTAKKSFSFQRKLPTSIRIINGKYLKLTRTPKIRMSKKLDIDGKIVECTITNEGNYWFASLVFKLDTMNIPKIQNNKYCGVDLGVRSLAIICGSDGLFKKYPSINKKLEILYKRVSFYQKQMKRRYNWNAKDPNDQSNRYFKAKTKFDNTWVRIKAIRKDYVEKIVLSLVRRYQYICIEDLAVKNMIKIRSHRVSDLISKSLWGLIRKRLIEKSEIYGNIIIIANRSFPSTQTCSRCGLVRRRKSKIHTEHIYSCLKCNLKIDRDFNAAINLKNYALANI